MNKETKPSRCCNKGCCCFSSSVQTCFSSFIKLKVSAAVAIENFFECLGHFVYDHPWWFITVPTIVCVFLSIGFFRRSFELDMERLYGLPTSPTAQAKNELNRVFPIERIQYIFASSTQEGELLSKENLENLDKFWNRVVGLKVLRALAVAASEPGGIRVMEDWLLANDPYMETGVSYYSNLTSPVTTTTTTSTIYENVSAGSTSTKNKKQKSSSADEKEFVTLEDVCIFDPNHRCRTRSVLNLYPSPSYYGSPLRTSRYPTMINFKSATAYRIDTLLGGIIKERKGTSSTTTIYNATVAVFRIDLDGSPDKVIQSLAWEQGLLALVKHSQIPNIKLYIRTDRSLPDELAESCRLKGDDLMMLVVAGLFVFVFTVAINSSLDRYRSNWFPAAVGVVSTLLAYGGGVGLCHLLGLKHVPPAESTPFIILGIGVDDIFVLSNAYSLTYLHSQDARTRMGLSLREAGISITLTTVTNILAFIVGGSSVYYSIRVFCILTASGLLFGYLLCLTLVAAVMSIHAKREQKYRPSSVLKEKTIIPEINDHSSSSSSTATSSVLSLLDYLCCRCFYKDLFLLHNDLLHNDYNNNDAPQKKCFDQTEVSFEYYNVGSANLISGTVEDHYPNKNDTHDDNDNMMIIPSRSTTPSSAKYRDHRRDDDNWSNPEPSSLLSSSSSAMVISNKSPNTANDQVLHIGTCVEEDRNCTDFRTTSANSTFPFIAPDLNSFVDHPERTTRPDHRNNNSNYETIHHSNHDDDEIVLAQNKTHQDPQFHSDSKLFHLPSFRGEGVDGSCCSARQPRVLTPHCHCTDGISGFFIVEQLNSYLVVAERVSVLCEKKNKKVQRRRSKQSLRERKRSLFKDDNRIRVEQRNSTTTTTNTATDTTTINTATGLYSNTHCCDDNNNNNDDDRDSPDGGSDHHRSHDDHYYVTPTRGVEGDGDHYNNSHNHDDGLHVMMDGTSNSSNFQQSESTEQEKENNDDNDDDCGKTDVQKIDSSYYNKQEEKTSKKDSSSTITAIRTPRTSRCCNNNIAVSAICSENLPLSLQPSSSSSSSLILSHHHHHHHHCDGGRSPLTSTLKFELADLPRLVQKQQQLIPIEAINFEEPRGTVGRWLRYFFAHYYGRVLVHPIMKIIVLAGFLALSIFSVYKAKYVNAGLQARDITPYGSYLREFYDVREKYFSSYGDECVVVFPYGQNWWDPKIQEKILSLTQSIRRLDHVVFVANGFEEFLRFQENRKKRPSSDIRKESESPFYIQEGESEEAKKEFMQLFHEFLKTPRGSNFNFTFTIKDHVLTSWKFYYWMKFQDNTFVAISWFQEVQRLLQDVSETTGGLVKGLVFTPLAIMWESDPQILKSTLNNMVTALIVMAVCASILIPDLRSGLLVLVVIIMIDLDVYVFMSLWGLNLNLLTMVNLVLSIGFAVDYTAHITHCFSHCKGKTRNRRVVETLLLMGLPVTEGLLSTYAAIAVLSFSKKYALIVVFRMTTLVMVFAFAHGILLMPVILSLVGPMNNNQEVDVVEMREGLVINAWKVDMTGKVLRQNDMLISRTIINKSNDSNEDDQASLSCKC